MTRALIGLLLCLFALSVLAANPSVFPRKFKPNQFDQVAELIQSEMVPGGQYAHVTPEQRDEVNKSLAVMGSLLEGRESLEDLNEDEKVALLNAQGEINAIFSGNEQDQLVCQRRTIPGTHLRESLCETKLDRKLRHEQSRDTARRLNKQIYIPQGE